MSVPMSSTSAYVCRSLVIHYRDYRENIASPMSKMAYMSGDGWVRLPEVLLVIVPGVAGEVWAGPSHGGSALDGGAAAGGVSHGSDGGDSGWGLHGGYCGAVGGEEVAVVRRVT